jgi:hypothetical protein
MAQTIKLSTLAVVLLVGLSACMGSDLERAGIGALAGCAIGELLDDGKCIAGAAVGAAGGALANDI